MSEEAEPLKLELEAEEAEEALQEIDIRESTAVDGVIPIEDAENLNRLRVRVIKPGWGSTGYYSPEVLKKAVEEGQFDGRHMHWDHRSANERPERSLQKFAGIIESRTAQYEESGELGPGVYAQAQVFPHWAANVAALAPHIGVSIVGGGMYRTGVAESKRGRIFQEINVEDVDFVTKPGAGGGIVTRFKEAGAEEAAPPPALEEKKPMPTETKVEAVAVDEAALRGQIDDLKAQVAALAEMQLKTTNYSIAESVVRSAELPLPVVDRVMSAVHSDSRITEAGTDVPSVVKEIIEAEMRYVRALNPAIGRAYGDELSLEESGKTLDDLLAETFGRDLEPAKE